MNFKTDENLPKDAVRLLLAAGHDAASVYGQGLSGASDEHLHGHCLTEGRVLITLDLDFANVQAYPPSSSAGLIVIRLPQQDKPHVLGVLERLVKVLETESPVGSLWIVDQHRVRIRK